MTRDSLRESDSVVTLANLFGEDLHGFGGRVGLGHRALGRIGSPCARGRCLKKGQRSKTERRVENLGVRPGH